MVITNDTNLRLSKQMIVIEVMEVKIKPWRVGDVEINLIIAGILVLRRIALLFVVLHGIVKFVEQNDSRFRL